MIRSLRIRFIAIAMGAVLLVPGGMMAAINVSNYVNINRNADVRLQMLAMNGGQFPMAVPGEPAFNGEEPPVTATDARPNEDNAPHRQWDGRRLTAEAPFEMRFFTVVLDDAGNTVATNIDRIAAVDEAGANAMATAVQGRTGGFYGDYKFTAVAVENGTMYIFLDCGRDLDTFRSFLWSSLWVSLIGLALVFLLVVIFSKKVIAPVAESYEKQKRFITDSSHEIKTPLTIIDANTEILEMEQGANEWTQSIRKQVARLTDLTGKLVLLSRMEEAGSRTPMVDFSLSDAVSEAAQPFAAVAEAAGKSLAVNVQPGLSLYGDEAAIRQAVGLLLDNAVKYSNEGGQIDVTLKAAGKHKVLTVANTADHVTDGPADRLFERFYRADASRNSETGGHGIGLSVVKAIAQTHKGKVAAVGRNGRMEFTVTL